MIEILNWFAVDRMRVAGFLISFCVMCYAISWIVDAANKEK